MTQLACSSPDNILMCLFLPSTFCLKPHVHVSLLTLVITNFSSRSVPCIKQLFVQLVYTLPFPVNIGKLVTEFFNVAITVDVTAESHPHLHPSPT